LCFLASVAEQTSLAYASRMLQNVLLMEVCNTAEAHLYGLDHPEKAGVPAL
jgi:hypothetical protein